VRRGDSRLSAPRAGVRFYSAVVDETEEWAQVMMQSRTISLFYLCDTAENFVNPCYWTCTVG